MLTLQAATWRDTLAVRRLFKDCFGVEAWDGLEIFFNLLGPNLKLKALWDGEWAGIVLAEDRLFEQVGWITALGVHPAYQRRGVGRRLLAAAENALLARTLKLTVRHNNAPALALYHAFGYTEERLIPNYYPNQQTGVVMRKDRSPNHEPHKIVFF